MEIQTKAVAELDAKLIRDYFGGRWTCTTYKNGELVRENAVEIKGSPEKPGGIGEIAFGILALGFASVDQHDQLAIAGWHSDINRWCDRCYNEAGGYSEHSWRSQGEINGVTVLYGTVHVCEKEGDDPADYIAMCELLDQDNFRYTIQSYIKGIVEIIAKRVSTAPNFIDTLERDQAAGVGKAAHR